MRFRCVKPEGDADPAIREAVESLLTECEILRPPTPIDRVLAHLRLTSEARREVVSSAIARRLKRTAMRFFEKLRNKLAGFLDIRERYIVVNPTLHRHRQRFLQFHEVGHDVLTWHHDLLVTTSVEDLRPNVRQSFEAEANCFAGHAIFQNDHMALGHRGHALRMAKLAGVAAAYEASLTATARQYVAIQDEPVALVVGKPHGEAGARLIRFTYALANPAFLALFGSELLNDHFGSHDAATAAINVAGVSVAESEIQVPNLRGEHRFLIAETIFNRYETLTLLHVKPSARSTSGRSLLRILGKPWSRRIAQQVSY